MLFLINYQSPVTLNSDVQNEEELIIEEAIIEEEIIEEAIIEEEIIEEVIIEEEIIENPDMPVIEPRLPGVVEEIIQQNIAGELSDCVFGKELRSTPENPMTYTCQLITLEGDVELSMNNAKFEQPEIQVKKGTTVTWINKDNSDPLYPEHTVVIDVLNVKSPEILFAGGSKEKWSYTFNEIGEFEYYCSIHPFMTGKIIVVE